MKFKLKIISVLMIMVILGIIAYISCGSDGGGGGTSLTVPSAPGAASITPDNGVLALTWDAVPGAASYEVWYGTMNSPAFAAQQGGDIAATSYTLTSLTNGLTYYVWLKAKNAAGTSDFGPVANGIPQIPLTAPEAPGAATVTSGNTQLSLSWTAVTGATAYEVWFGTSDSVAASSKYGQDVAVTNTVIYGLANGTTYYVWLKAKNSVGTSGFSAAASGTPLLTAPAAPGAATLTSGNTQLSLSWTAVADATAYEVWYGTTAASGSASKFGSDVTGTSTAITALANGTTYYVWLKAKNSAGTSGFGTVSYCMPGAAGTTVTYTLPGAITVNMKYVPAGTFPTGTSYHTQPGQPGANPATVAASFLMAETETTYQLWSAVYISATGDINMDGGVAGGEIPGAYIIAHPGAMGDGSGDTNQHPVTTISWRDAMVWCNALTEHYNANNGTAADLDCVYYTDSAYTIPIRTSTAFTTIKWDAGSTYSGTEDEPFVKASAKGFRLPSRLEWECAARYKDGINWTAGDCASGAADNLEASAALVGWYGANSGTSTHIVATKTANVPGIRDMSGNVYEFCFDWLGAGTSRVHRGGSYMDMYSSMQVGALSGTSPYMVDNRLGFRISRSQ